MSACNDPPPWGQQPGTATLAQWQMTVRQWHLHAQQLVYVKSETWADIIHDESTVFTFGSRMMALAIAMRCR